MSENRRKVLRELIFSLLMLLAVLSAIRCVLQHPGRISKSFTTSFG